SLLHTSATLTEVYTLSLHDALPICGAEVQVLVVHRGVAAGHRLEAIVEVHDDLGQRQLVDKHHARLARIADLPLQAAPLLAQREHVAEELDRQVDRRSDVWLLDAVDLEGRRQLRRAVDYERLPVALDHPVGDRGRGGDERESELALETLLDDLHVQEPEEAAAEAEAERE